MLWNKLPREIRAEAKLIHFKKSIRKWLVEHIPRFGWSSFSWVVGFPLPHISRGFSLQEEEYSSTILLYMQRLHKEVFLFILNSSLPNKSIYLSIGLYSASFRHSILNFSIPIMMYLTLRHWRGAACFPASFLCPLLPFSQRPVHLCIVVLKYKAV